MDGFALKPYEDVIGGVRYRDGLLRLRPTIGATALDLYATGVGIALVLVGAATGSLIAVIGGATFFLVGCRYFACRVTAGDGTIVVVNKWRRYTVPTDRVRSVRVDVYHPLTFWPFMGPTTLWPRSLAAASLLLTNGSAIRCDALVGLPRDIRIIEPTHVETKAAILQRYIDAAAR